MMWKLKGPDNFELKVENFRRWDVGLIEIIREMQAIYRRMKAQILEDSRKERRSKKERPSWVTKILLVLHLCPKKMDEKKRLIAIAMVKVNACVAGFNGMSDEFKSSIKQLINTRNYHPDRMHKLHNDVFSQLEIHQPQRAAFAKQVMTRVAELVQGAQSAESILEEAVQFALRSRIKQFCLDQVIENTFTALSKWCHNDFDLSNPSECREEMRHCCIIKPAATFVKHLMQQNKIELSDEHKENRHNKISGPSSGG